MMKYKELAVRVLLLLAGLTIAHLGVTLFLESDLGADPFNVLIQGLYRGLPWPDWMTHGRVHLSVSLLIVGVLLVAARSYIRIGTVVCAALVGPSAQLFLPVSGRLCDFCLRKILGEDVSPER